jgi:hypothetical protein
MTGLGGPGGDMAFGGPPGGTTDIPGMGGTYAPDTAYTPDSAWGGPPGSFGPGGTTTDPNTAAAQAQQPTPGTSPTSIGGTQSGTAQPGTGGQGAGQMSKMIQDAVKALQEGSQQQQQKTTSAAAPSSLSPTLSDLSNITQTALQPPTPQPSPEMGWDPQANFPGQQTQDTEQPFPSGRQDTGPTGSAEEGKPMPDQSLNIGQGFGGGSPTQQQDVTAAPPGPSPQATHPSVNWADFPENQQAAATPDQAPDKLPSQRDVPAATTPSKVTPTAPAAPVSTGPISSRGQAPGAQPPGAQGFNPFRALIDVLTGNFSDLNRMAQEANPNAYPYGGTQPAAATPAAAPPTRDTGTPSPPATGPQVADQPPTTGSADVNRKSGAPDADPNTPDDGFKAQRQEWYKSHDRTEPFPHDVGKGFQGGPMAGRPDTPTAAQPGAAAPVNVQDYTRQANLPGHGRMAQVRGVTIHNSGPGISTPDQLANTLRQRGLGAQYFIDRNGQVYKMGPDNAVQFHMKNGGTGTIGGRGAGFNNSNMIGIEMAGNDRIDDTTPAQRQAAAQLVNQLGQQYQFDPKQAVFGHGELNGHKEQMEGMNVVRAIRSGQYAGAQPSAAAGTQNQGNYAQADQYDGRGRGGTRGDRNNNPGNIKTANAPGQVGRDREGHGIFRTWGDGRRAQAALLQRSYNNQTVPQMARYANFDRGWVQNVMRYGGFGPNERLDLNNPQTLDRLQRAIFRAEGTRIPGGRRAEMQQPQGTQVASAEQTEPPFKPLTGQQYRRGLHEYERQRQLQTPGPGPGEPGLVYPPGWPINDPTGVQGRDVVVSEDENLARRFGLDWV